MSNFLDAAASVTHPHRKLTGNLTGTIWNSAYATIQPFTTAQLVALEQIIYRDFNPEYVKTYVETETAKPGYVFPSFGIPNGDTVATV